MRDGQQMVDRVQLTAVLVRVVHPGHPGAQLETERGVVAELRGHLGQPLAAHVEGQLAAVRDYLLDRVGEADPGRLQRPAQGVGDVVEVGAVRARAGQDRGLVHPEQAEARGVRGVLQAEHAGADDRLGQPLLAQPGREVLVFPGRGGARGGRTPRSWQSFGRRGHGSLRSLRAVGLLRPRLMRLVRTAHSCDPSGEVRCSGARPSRAFSSSVISRSRFLPSFMFMILSCSLTMESSSISGRGGQPGR